jgi:hypothetical protein
MGNSNNLRYYRYWFDLPGTPELYMPKMSDVTTKILLAALGKTGLVDVSVNGGVYETISPDTNEEFQDARAENEKTHGNQMDGIFS